ncbi:hypothetical protein [Coleofasciculus sp. FACHB-64]|nr:hypothetical protein [Coleofasciculus sp. FACHB-64]
MAPLGGDITLGRAPARGAPAFSASGESDRQFSFMVAFNRFLT